MKQARIGRLFWKFFLFFWLAQLLTSVGVGVTMWWLHPGHGPETHRAMPAPDGLTPERMRQPPPRHRPEERAFPVLLRPPVMPLVAGSVVSLMFAAALAWYFSRPIGSLRKAFDEVAGGKLDVRVGEAMAGRQDELADLGDAFDRMAARLQGLVDGQRRLLHDVSHELRSPLARLQAACDLLAQQPERAAEFVERIERETGRMDRLVGELLTLARLDAGMVGERTELIDLDELVADIADDAQFEGQARQCRVLVDVAGGVQLRGNRELLHRALENVVRNALRHSPEGGEVTIRAALTGATGDVRLVVEDNGPGLPDAELEAIFQPFMRSAGADAFAGYGLGLAITRRVLSAHGGSVQAANRAGGGLQVVLQVPSHRD